MARVSFGEDLTRGSPPALPPLRKPRPSLLWALLVRGYGYRLGSLGLLRAIYIALKYSQPILMNLLIKSAGGDDDDAEVLINCRPETVHVLVVGDAG